MALIACPECQREISNQATACPHCGHPIHNSGKTVMTTQATGKLPKIGMILGTLLMIAGVASCGMSLPHDRLSGGGLFVGGLMLFIAARAFAWWKHG